MSAESTVVPNQPPALYPTSLGSMPLDRAYLRPFDGSLFDTEIWADNLNRLRFFERQIDQPMWMNDYQQRPLDEHGRALDKKTKDDTNLWQSKMLDYPREVSVGEAGIFFADTISEQERTSIIENGTFEFVLRDSEFFEIPIERRMEFNIPLADFPDRCMERGARGIVKKEKDLGNGRMLPDNRLPESMRLKLPKPFQIKPGEEFFVTLKIKNRPKVSNRVKVTVALSGKIWLPI